MILNLRKISGVDIIEFKEKFKENVFEIFGKEIDKLKKQNLIKNNNKKNIINTKRIGFCKHSMARIYIIFTKTKINGIIYILFIYKKRMKKFLNLNC